MSPTEHLRRSLAPLGHDLPAGFPEALLEHAETRALPARHVLEAPGTVAERLYFLHAGFAHQFAADARGRRRTSYFWGAGDLVARLPGYLAGERSERGIRLVEPSVVVGIARATLADLVDAWGPKLQPLVAAVSAHYLARVTRLNDLRQLPTPEARFARLHTEYPSYVSSATDTQLGTLIGVTRETYNRLKSSAAPRSLA